jgi:hypothetical protein
MKMRMGKIISTLAVLVLSGCVTMPNGPSVRVLPGPGKSFEQFQTDDIVCRRYAEQSIGVSPQQTVNQSATTGAVVGTAIGAGVGALLGAASGHAGAGAAIGAGSGLLVGTASGANAGNISGYEAQRRYDNTYIQCMYAKGNQVPGTVRTYRTRRTAPPPPDMNSVPPDYVPYDTPPPPQ